MSNNKRTQKRLPALLALFTILAFSMSGCSGGEGTATVASPSGVTPTTSLSTGAAVIGTVPGTLIEAFCDNGSYYSTTSTQNGTSEHPFNLQLPADIGCRLVMTTNEGTADEVVSPIGFLDINNEVNTRLTLADNSTVDLGFVPLPMSRAEASNNDINGDGILDAPFILDNYQDQGAINPLKHMDSDHDGIKDWQDEDHGDPLHAGTANDILDKDMDGIPNNYDHDFIPEANDTDGDGIPDRMDVNPENHKDQNSRLAGDHDGDGYHDSDRDHDGFLDEDHDRDGEPDNNQTIGLTGANAGAILFGSYCSSCHLPDGYDLGTVSAEAIGAALNGVPDMVGVAALVTGQDYQALADFINMNGHDSGWAIEENHGGYVKINGVDVCAACHGADLNGNVSIPSCYSCHDNKWGAGPGPLPTPPSGPGANRAPVADAGPNQNVIIGDTVNLDGSGSHDADNDILSYNWSMPGSPPGSAAALPNPYIINPAFIADVAGTYTIQLVVNDGTANSNTATMNVTATPVIDGASLYGTNCAMCHGPLATSSKRGASAAKIQSAINNNRGGMGRLNTFASAEISAIAAVLTP
ncbi:MAG: hypothetical protein GXP53_02845 [Deltaproteobacteria bacterium]|nr:hypothetical protein [Deltaproteobacteria bacterium]